MRVGGFGHLGAGIGKLGGGSQQGSVFDGSDPRLVVVAERVAEAHNVALALAELVRKRGASVPGANVELAQAAVQEAGETPSAEGPSQVNGDGVERGMC